MGSHDRSPQPGYIHHLEINTAHLSASKDFWDEFLHLLGYKLKDTFENGVSWINGDQYLVLVQAESLAQFDETSPGLNHVAFHGRSRDHVDEVTTFIRDRSDATVLFEDGHPFAGGYYALYARGPDEIKIEVVSPE
ncbi:VOC family protein (plasmid) [Haloferax sp. S1W]|uniref:VOC family protein n=1 Tax=Haloferax sp. S1W TaxID=3377110 RepID=UPI0037CC4749